MSAALLCLAWVFVTASVGAWATMRSRRSIPGSSACGGPVLLLRPCAGYEAALARALASSSVVPPDSRVRFLVAEPGDGAEATAREVCATLVAQGLDAQVLVTGARAANRKTDQLARAMQLTPANGDVVVVADSDVELTAEVVAELVRSPSADAAGAAVAAWAPPVEVAPRTAGDRASQAVLDASLHAFALLGALDSSGMVGKLFAVRRDALAVVGGFDALTGYLGEDMELARRWRDAGLRVHRTVTPARSLAAGRSWPAVVRRYARWLKVLRAQRPWLLLSYPLILAAAPLQVGLALAAMATSPWMGLGALGAVLAARWSVAVFARVRSMRPLGGLLMAPWVADVTLLAAFGLALVSRSFEWRGVPLRVEGQGVVAAVKR